jgi:hypothetical protein
MELASVDIDRKDQLLSSLVRDARRVAQHFGFGGDDGGEDYSDPQKATTFIALVYKQVHGVLKNQAGYGHLYQEAWRILSQAAEHQHWNALSDIDALSGSVGEDFAHHFTTVPISHWHIKTIVYAWSRANHHHGKILLDRMRMFNAFINMSPREAELRLVKTSINNEATTRRYFLFRLSTTVAGVISLSYMTPMTGRVAHVRIADEKHAEMFTQLLAHDNDIGAELLYRALVHDDTGAISATGCTIAMRKLDPFASASLIERRLVQHFQKQHRSRTEGGATVYDVLRELFFADVSWTIQLIPEGVRDRLGLTDSYVDTYVNTDAPHRRGSSKPGSFGMSTDVTNTGSPTTTTSTTTTTTTSIHSLSLLCFRGACRSSELGFMDELSNRLYCSEDCCARDSVNCY